MWVEDGWFGGWMDGWCSGWMNGLMVCHKVLKSWSNLLHVFSKNNQITSLFLPNPLSLPRIIIYVISISNWHARN